jgi:O-antigen biosynthesis protein
MRFAEKILLLTGKRSFRAYLNRRFNRDLQNFLKSDQQIVFQPVVKPEVTVIIPVFNSAHHTLRCLQSIAKDKSTDIEVIVFDNGSHDDTIQLLSRCKNIVVIKSSENLGFIKAVNAASKYAQGQFVLLLNNDATILSGRIRDAMDIFRTEEDVGAVGARIKLATGHVQEAGSIIFSDGTTDGYLRNKKRDHFSGMYMRDVDFCSGVFLMLERQMFADMGGLDEIFSPAYYEETDLCMRLRARGRRVIYDPTLLIEHFEFGSQPTAAAFDAISKRLPIFLDRWQGTLNAEGFFKRSKPHIAASRRLISRPRLLLIIDNASLEEIARCLQDTLQSANKNKWQISLFVSGLRDVRWEHFHSLFGKKMELVLNSGAKDILKLITERKDFFDVISAIGAVSTDALEILCERTLINLSQVKVVSGLNQTELEKLLEKPPIFN